MASLQKAFKHMGQFAKQWMKEACIPGLAIAVTDREKLLKVSTYGFADIATQSPITPDTLFEIGSLGKPFTSIALLQLRDEGRLDLHAPVAQYLPWFRVQSAYPPITVHHLLNHTAGIINGTGLAPHGLYECWALRETKTGAPPGTYFSYSNLGYKILGFLLERLTGQSLPEAMQSRILDPLGMIHSYPAITFETRTRSAIGYCSLYDDRPEHPSHGLVPAIWAEYGMGDGCQVSTAGDMAIYLRMLLNWGRGPQGRLISEESFDLLTQQGVWTGGDYYGYALATAPGNGCPYLHHGGGNERYMAAIVVDMEAGFGIVFLANRTGDTGLAEAAALHVLTVLRAAHRQQALPPLPPVTYPSLISHASDYAGIYRSGNRELDLATAEGHLVLTYDGRMVALEQRAPDRFYVGHPDFDLFLLEFNRQDGKVVEAFHGSHWYITDDYSGPQHFDYPQEWEAYTGHYRAHNLTLSNFRVVLRKGALVLIYPTGATEPLTLLGAGVFRIGEEERSPETLRFDPVVEGQALRADYSGCPYYRTFTP